MERRIRKFLTTHFKKRKKRKQKKMRQNKVAIKNLNKKSTKKSTGWVKNGKRKRKRKIHAINKLYDDGDTPRTILQKLDEEYSVIPQKGDIERWTETAERILGKIHNPLNECIKKDGFMIEKYEKPQQIWNSRGRCMPEDFKTFFDKQNKIFNEFANEDEYFCESHFQLFCLVFLLNSKYVNKKSIEWEKPAERARYLGSVNNKTTDGYIDIFYRDTISKEPRQYKIEVKIILPGDYDRGADGKIIIKPSSHQERLGYPIGGGIGDVKRQALLQARSYQIDDAISASLVLVLGANKSEVEVSQGKGCVNLPNLKENPVIDELSNDDLKYAYNQEFIDTFMEECKAEVQEQIQNLREKIHLLETKCLSYDALKDQYRQRMAGVVIESTHCMKQ